MPLLLFINIIFILVVKFGHFSFNASHTSAPEVNIALLPVETSDGTTGYPPIKHTLLCDNLIWTAREGGAVEAFSVSELKLTETLVFPFSEDQKLLGLFEYEENSVLAVSNRGDLVTWSSQDLTPKPLGCLPGINEIQTIVKHENLLAVGGR